MEAIAEALGRVSIGSVYVLISSLDKGIQKGGRTKEMIRDALPFIRRSLMEYGGVDDKRIAELLRKASRGY
jgi:hypothetical protein